MRRLPLATLATLAFLTLACSESPAEPATPAAADTADATDAGVDTLASEDLAPDVPEPDVPHDVPKADVAFTPPIPCNSNQDCATGYCLPTPAGSQCARLCVDGGGCPAEFKCQEIAASGDVVFACVHPTPFHCRPCHSDADCGAAAGKKGRCTDLGPGAACLEECTVAGAACVTMGATCSAVPGGGFACVPANNACPCPEGKSGTCKVKNAFGACTGGYVCQGGAPGTCVGPTAAAETCNGVDDDCDGKADDEVPEAVCAIPNVYGTCKGKTLCVGGQSLCLGSPAAPEV